VFAEAERDVGPVKPGLAATEHNLPDGPPRLLTREAAAGGFDMFDELRLAFASFASSSAMRASSRSMIAYSSRSRGVASSGIRMYHMLIL
jgi:hypothetical protein